MNNELEIKGKDIEDAINKAANELNTTKDNIEYEVIEESNKTLFSILSPKYAIIKAKIIDESKRVEKKVEEVREKVEIEPLTNDEKEIIKVSISNFLDDFLKAMKLDFKYTIIMEENDVKLEIEGDNSGLLIGYRGEILDSLQVIVNLIANKQLQKRVRIQLDTENYREKRKKTLENLAYRLAETVVKTGKGVTLEPMIAYERKIIHSSLQQNNKVETKSIGEEPYRKVVITLKK